MKKITVSILTTLLMLSMVFSSSVFAANEETSAWDSFLGLFSAKTAATSDVGVEYRGHVQNKGDFPLDGSWIQGPNVLGTVGESLRLEAFWIKLTNDVPAGLHIQYRVHVQNKGWMAPVEDGALAGTQGESLQIESVEIKLVDDAGNPAVGYSVEYRGHIQNKGDMPADGSWYKDGEQLGTVGEFLRLEALEVKIVQTKADMTAYNAAVAAAGALTEADYTADSWAALETALATVVTEDNTQAEVDAATAAINAAIDALVLVPTITGVEATAATTLTVSFNTAISPADQALTTFAVKRGVSAVTMLAPVWAADGKSVELARSSNLIAGTYTVTASGIDLKTATATTVVEAQEATEIVILSGNVQNAASVDVSYVVNDQYGNDMEIAAGAITAAYFNTTDSARAVVGTSLAGANFSATQIGDQVRVTAYLTADSSISTTKVINVSNIYPASVEFGAIVLPEDVTKAVVGTNDVELPLTVLDNFGTEMAITDDAALATGDALLPTDLILTYSNLITGVGIEDNSLVFDLTTDGDAWIRVTNPATGQVKTFTFTILEAPTVTGIVFGDLEDELIAGDTDVEMAVSFLDQYGEAIDVAATFNLTTVFNISEVPTGDLNIEASLVGGKMRMNPADDGTVNVTFTNTTTGTQYTHSFTILEAREAAELVIETAPDAAVVQASSTTLQFKVIDQYGDDFATAGQPVEVNWSKESAANSILAAPAVSGTIAAANIGNAITITGGTTTGSDTITYELENTGTSTVLDAKEITVANVAYSASFEATVNNTVYTAGDSIAMTVTALDAGGDLNDDFTGTFASVVTVRGDVGGDNTDLVYNRTLSFVNGVATVNVPATIAGDGSIKINFNQGNATPGDVFVDTSLATVVFEVNAGAISQVGITAANASAVITVTGQDAFGNTVETFTGLKTVKVTSYVDSSDVAKTINGVSFDNANEAITTFTAGTSANMTLGEAAATGDVITVTVGGYTGTVTV